MGVSAALQREHGHPKMSNRTGTHMDGYRVNQDPAHEIAGLEYLFANKKDFVGMTMPARS